MSKFRYEEKSPDEVLNAAWHDHQVMDGESDKRFREEVIKDLCSAVKVEDGRNTAKHREAVVSAAENLLEAANTSNGSSLLSPEKLMPTLNEKLHALGLVASLQNKGGGDIQLTITNKSNVKYSIEIIQSLAQE